ncbi:MAG: HAD family phosphatase [Crocinitomicaceae bacterium]|jgi:glucose-1-phosphatase|nr:HAD family phosphatase [Crocinitomicaceae bacterium]
MKKITAYLFDLGGVIVDVDYQKTISKFSSLGVNNANELYNQFNQSGLFDKYEKGVITSDFFIKQLKPLTNDGVSESQIVDAWNAMIGEFPVEKLDFIAGLSSQKPCCLLSNTNEIHLKKVMENLSKTPYESLASLFKNCYYSHLIGKRKPDIETFEWVINQMGVTAEETLFIDDSPQHIEGAKKAGLQTVFYQKKEDLLDLKDRI